jgi:tetratricopeptide (TPR) repeat protein
VSRSLFLARRYEEAIHHARRTLEVNPDYGPLLAQVCRCNLLLGDYAAAEAACLREKEVSGSGRTLSMALVRSLQGDREGALAEVGGLSAEQPSGGPQPIFVAMVFTGLGEVDEAFRWLDQAFDEDYPYLEYLPSNPFFDPLRDDPRYAALLNRIGL